MENNIITDRCRLNAVTSSHVEILHTLWTLPEVKKYLWDDEDISLSLVEELITKSIEYHHRKEFGLWVVHLQEENSVIGFGGFWPFHEPQRIELLYGLKPNYWGQGYATEIATALLGYGKDTLSMQAILASTDEPNRASLAVLHRLGMQQTHFDVKTKTCFFEKLV